MIAIRQKSCVALLALYMIVHPGIALAHSGHPGETGFGQGFFHPFSGLDHLLAMTSVGLLAFRLAGHSLYLVPSSFIAAMALGGALGMAGMSLPAVETGIAFSLVVLGALVASRWHPRSIVAASIIAVFAICHGYAHGAEMPTTSSSFAYGAGFISATAILHVLGIAAAALCAHFESRIRWPVLRGAGAAIAMCGVAFLAGVV